MFEIDKIIWNLKKEIKNNGLRQEELKQYISFLENSNSKRYNIKELPVLVLSYFGVDNLVKILSSVKIDGTTVNLNIISNFFNVNNNVIIWGVTISFCILSIKVMHEIINIDNLYRDSQRIFVFKRIIDIWDYEEEQSIKKLEEAIEKSKENNNLIFTNLEFSRTKFDKDLIASMGIRWNTICMLLLIVSYLAG